VPLCCCAKIADAANSRACAGEITLSLEISREGPPDRLPETWLLSRRIFLGSLGLVYLIAFASLWLQLDGLIGSHGISPAASYLEQVAEQLGTQRYLRVPSLFWLSAGDPVLHTACGLGVVAALLLVAGVAPGPSLALLWGLYLSLAAVAGEFLSYQWDTLLLEAGLLACFIAPWRLRPGASWKSGVPAAPLWALRWLLFRLVFTSGVGKLASGDPTWRDLTALEFHYFTQPIPTWTSYYAHHLPPLLHKLATAGTLAIEIVAPLLIFAPGRLPIVSAAAIGTLMVAIGLTGNYGFFNLLTLALCVLLIGDRSLRALLPEWLRRRLPPPDAATPARGRARRVAAFAFVVALAAIGSVHMLDRIGARLDWPAPVRVAVRAAAPFRSTNGYGLFTVMSTDRPEIVIEGSQDGQHWLPYEFRWKPGRLDVAPAFAQPHMPRLDWQMWFAALRGCRRNSWFVHFQERLLAGESAVAGLLGSDPFVGRPPRWVRSTLYHYEFSELGTREADTHWWRRRPLRPFCPTFTLQEGQLTIAPR
jgi:uncharacterized membrane protein YphA (DoxX/SURF4 family)